MKKLLTTLLCLTLVLSLMGTASAEEEKVLNITSWLGYIDDDTIAAFEQETGIRVVWSPMDSIDNMLLKVTEGGGSAYDLILSSDYSLDILRQGGYIQKLDKSLLSNYANLNPYYLGQTFDPDDEYVIPYVAGCPLIIYDPSRVDVEIKGYNDLFNEKLVDSVAMLENARVFCGIMLKSIGQSFNVTDPEVLAQMKEKMMPLYKNIRVFGDDAAYSAMLGGDTPVGFLFTSYVYFLQMEREAAGQEPFAVVYPEEGIGYGIDGLVIPAGCAHPGNAHLFLDYLMRPEVAAHNAEAQGYMCVNKAAEEYLSDYFKSSPIVNIPEDVLANAEFILNVGQTEVTFQEIYTEFKNQ